MAAEDGTAILEGSASFSLDSLKLIINELMPPCRDAKGKDDGKEGSQVGRSCACQCKHEVQSDPLLS